MAKEELPPLDYDAKFDGYGFFDPRAFWEKVAIMDRERQPGEPKGAKNKAPIDAKGRKRESSK
jgi:hypothetical protein